jgi:hypothetical protein
MFCLPQRFLFAVAALEGAQGAVQAAAGRCQRAVTESDGFSSQGCDVARLCGSWTKT